MQSLQYYIIILIKQLCLSKDISYIMYAYLCKLLVVNIICFVLLLGVQSQFCFQVFIFQAKSQYLNKKYSCAKQYILHNNMQGKREYFLYPKNIRVGNTSTVHTKTICILQVLKECIYTIFSHFTRTYACMFTIDQLGWVCVPKLDSGLFRLNYYNITLLYYAHNITKTYL